MSVNLMNFEQASTILAEIVTQATGQKTLAPTNISEFTSVATTALQVGYDPLVTAISQVIGRTIIVNRPYYAKFRSMQVDNQKWGAITRKINFVDTPLEDNQDFDLENGQSVDMYKVQKAVAVQTNFYGAEMLQKHITIYETQLDNAFSNPTDFALFVSGLIQNSYDHLEQVREAMGRQTVLNFMAGKQLGDPNNVIHLLDIYEEETGIQIATEDVYKPENFTPLMRWLSGYMKTLANFMSERGVKYHQNITGKPIMRHTPMDKLKVYMNTGVMNNMQSTVMSETFHRDDMAMIRYEEINYWQSIDSPTSFSITPTYMKNDGTLQTSTTNVALNNVLAVMFDEEAMGMSIFDQKTRATPPNVAGSYYNLYFKEVIRTWNDFTENGIVICLDRTKPITPPTPPEESEEQ